MAEMQLTWTVGRGPGPICKHVARCISSTRSRSRWYDMIGETRVSKCSSNPSPSISPVSPLGTQRQPGAAVFFTICHPLNVSIASKILSLSPLLPSIVTWLSRSWPVNTTCKSANTRFWYRRTEAVIRMVLERCLTVLC